MRSKKSKAPSTTSVRYPDLPEDPSIVRRARFTDVGEVVEESTFTKEGRWLEKQAPLPMGCGERPAETAGPLFSQEVK
jgi:hypothetical protein